MGEKYMKLAEFEAETICNLEKENFKLSDALNSAEEKLEIEREKNKSLENDLMKSRDMLEELTTADGGEKQTKSKSNQELLDMQDQLQAANQLISQLKRENVELKVQERLNEATEAEQDLIKVRE